MGVYQDELRRIYNWDTSGACRVHLPLEDTGDGAALNIGLDGRYAPPGSSTPAGTSTHTGIVGLEDSLIPAEEYSVDYGYIGKTFCDFTGRSDFDWAAMWVLAEPGEIICRWYDSVRNVIHQVRLDDQGRYEFIYFTEDNFDYGVYTKHTLVTAAVDTNVAHQVIVRHVYGLGIVTNTAILIDGTEITASDLNYEPVYYETLQIGGFTLTDTNGDPLTDSNGYLLTL